MSCRIPASFILAKIELAPIAFDRELFEKGCLDLSKAGELGDREAYRAINERCN